MILHHFGFAALKVLLSFEHFQFHHQNLKKDQLERNAYLIDRSYILPLRRCLISKSEVQGFVERCMTSVGTQPHHARSLAEVLVEGDHRGHYSHGLNRMGQWGAERSPSDSVHTSIE